MNLLTQLVDATIVIGGTPILWREIIGNGFGLASAIGGMKRVVWAWPVGIAGNLILFTVFLGGVFHTPQNLDLYGQAGRQIMFLIVSLYGWWSWSRARRTGLKESQETDPARSIITEPHEDRSSATTVGVDTRADVHGCLRHLRHYHLRMDIPQPRLLGADRRRLDFRRLHAGNLRHGPRVDRVLADLDRSRHSRRATSAGSRLLPLRGALHRLRMLRHLGASRLDQSTTRTKSEARPACVGHHLSSVIRGNCPRCPQPGQSRFPPQ